MAASSVSSHFKDLAEIVKEQEPLASFTQFHVGGAAELFIQPRNLPELSQVVSRCQAHQIPMKVLGKGSNVLIPDEGIRGVVLRLEAPAFSEITAQGKRIRAGCGAPLSTLISEAARHHLAGLESFVGIPGSVGGALKHNAGDRVAEIGQFVCRVDVMDSQGQVVTREKDELRFSNRQSNLDDPVLLSAEFELETDTDDAIVKRIKKAWIHRKSSHPFSSQWAIRIFLNPPGLNAGDLIEKAGMVGTKVGGAMVNDRDPNFFIISPGSSSRDILRLVELVRNRVAEKYKVDLELDISVW